MFDQDIKAGTSIRWRILPVDSYDNKIKINLEKASLKQNLFKFNYRLNNVLVENSEIARIAPDATYYYFDMVLEKQGDYTFSAFYQENEIDTQVDMITVLPLEASF